MHAIACAARSTHAPPVNARTIGQRTHHQDEDLRKQQRRMELVWRPTPDLPDTAIWAVHFAQGNHSGLSYGVWLLPLVWIHDAARVHASHRVAAGLQLGMGRGRSHTGG